MKGWVGHVGVGWVMKRGGHEGVGWFILVWGGSYRWVGHTGLGWLMKRWGQSCRDGVGGS